MNVEISYSILVGYLNINVSVLMPSSQSPKQKMCRGVSHTLHFHYMVDNRSSDFMSVLTEYRMSVDLPVI